VALVRGPAADEPAAVAADDGGQDADPFVQTTFLVSHSAPLATPSADPVAKDAEITFAVPSGGGGRGEARFGITLEESTS
jgi:hypothetical protein